MYDDHPLTLAARYGDAGAEEHGLQRYMQDSLGLSLEVALYVARQRSMRMVLMGSRGPEFITQMSRTEMTHIRLRKDEEEAISDLTVLYLDGIALGYLARKMEQNEEGV